MGCFDTDTLSDSGTRNGSVTPVWVGGLLVWVRLSRANMTTVAEARRFVASRGARRSGIAAPLCHIWLPAAPLRQLASSYEHARKSSPALHLMHAWWNPDRVLGKSALFMIFRLEAVPEQTVLWPWSRALAEKKVFVSRPWKLVQTTGLLKSFKMGYRTRSILNFWQSYGHLKMWIFPYKFNFQI